MKKVKVALLLCLAALALGGCKKEKAVETEPVQETQAPTEQSETALKIEPETQDNEHSYLTGKKVDPSIGRKRPIAIMFNNIVNACPQAGIARADVVYEAPVEGGITRLMGIFEDYQGMEKIGSVRSCRDYYVRYALEFDAIYTHFGQAVYAFDLLNSDKVNNISGLEMQEQAGKLNGYAGEDIFYRTSDRPSPHNVYTSEESLKTAIERKEYRTDYDTGYQGHYQFAADGETVSLEGGAATHIEPGYEFNHPDFEYHSDDGLYYRSQYGDAQIDQLTEEQLTYTNIIFQVSQWENYDDNGYLNIDTVSGGDAYVFTNGTYVKGTWKKKSEDAPARYYDANGEEITLNQGKTWVCIIQDTYQDKISFS